MATLSVRIEEIELASTMSGGIFDPVKIQSELKELCEKRETPGFWNDRRAAQSVIDQITLREKPLKTLDELRKSLDDAPST